MRLLFSNEWLRRKIASDPDTETEAGRSLTSPAIEEFESGKEAIMPPRNVTQMRIALGAFVHQLRQRDRLTLQELAIKADVSESELREVETNPTYTAAPRLIFRLSRFFGMELNNLYQLSGRTLTVDRKLYNATVQWAAHSDDLTPLTQEQLEALNSLVAVLSERSEEDSSMEHNIHD
jgi:transcriptional regulator with XRE-family HTH domain